MKPPEEASSGSAGKSGRVPVVGTRGNPVVMIGPSLVGGSAGAVTPMTISGGMGVEGIHTPATLIAEPPASSGSFPRGPSSRLLDRMIGDSLKGR